MRIPAKTKFWRHLSAFTRLDLLGIVGGFVLIALAVLPSLGNPPAWGNFRNRSERLVCLNNLRQIGGAFNVWMADHDEQYPFYLNITQGGTVGSPLAPNAYFQFGVLSNELRTPKVLACPTDERVRVATDFSHGPGGFFNPGFANNAVSYFLTHPNRGRGNSEILAGDRNLRGVGASGCAFFGSVMRVPLATSGWSYNVHGHSGNVVLSGGEARELPNSALSQYIIESHPNGREIHLVGSSDL
jgi:hypothetical protein